MLELDNRGHRGEDGHRQECTSPLASPEQSDYRGWSSVAKAVVPLGRRR